MAAKTYHIYPTNGSWTVKKEGLGAKTFRTQGDAIQAARIIAKKAASGQLVVHGSDGSITRHETYGLTPVQDPPRKSQLAKRIGRAVGRVALKRLQTASSPTTSRVNTSPPKK